MRSNNPHYHYQRDGFDGQRGKLARVTRAAIADNRALVRDIARGTVDFTIIGSPGDTVFLADPGNDRARHFLVDTYADVPETMFYGEALVIEHRYIFTWVNAMREDGWNIVGDERWAA